MKPPIWVALIGFVIGGTLAAITVGQSGGLVRLGDFGVGMFTVGLAVVTTWIFTAKRKFKSGPKK